MARLPLVGPFLPGPAAAGRCAIAGLACYALLVVAGLVVLFLAYTGRVRLPLYAIGALIVVLAVLIVAGLLWLLLSSPNPG